MKANLILFQELDKRLSEKLPEFTMKCESLRRAVSNNPTGKIDLTSLVFPRKMRKKQNWIKLALIRWYLPSDIACLVHLWLEENIIPEFEAESSLLLSSKNLALSFIITEYTAEDIFGNILKEEDGIGKQSILEIKTISDISWSKLTKSQKKFNRSTEEEFIFIKKDGKEIKSPNPNYGLEKKRPVRVVKERIETTEKIVSISKQFYLVEFQNTSFRKINQKVKKKVFHRGYRDKGSLRFPHDVVGTGGLKLEDENTIFVKETDLLLRKKILLNRCLEFLAEIGKIA